MEYPECRKGIHLVKKRCRVWILSLEELPWLPFVYPTFSQG